MRNLSVQIVTFNSAADIGPCLDSLEQQSLNDFQVRILDNASTDETMEAVSKARRPLISVRSETNIGFAAGHNRLARDFPADYILFLNPDTVLEPEYLARTVEAMDAAPKAASATGKLLRMDGATIDSTGIVMTRNQRHLDRGAGETDRGQYETAGEVFGPSGAAALYRYASLEAVSIDGMFFDEDFFAYREDADLAWRCRLMGWTSLYVPTAVGRHRRKVTPQRRSMLSKTINRHSVKNRFLLRINNLTPGLYRRYFWRVTARDCAVLGYVLLREWSSIPALWYVVRNRKRLWMKRRSIQSRVSVSDESIARWFR